MFKGNLQKFMSQFPDRPPTPNYVGLNNNSLLEWVSGSRDHNTSMQYQVLDDIATAPVEEQLDPVMSTCH